MESIQKALEALHNANYVGYFSEIETVVPASMRTTYQELKSKFMAGRSDWNFAQQLEIFARETERRLGDLSNTPEPTQQFNKQEVLGLIDRDLDQAFDKLDNYLDNTSSIYNDLCDEYISRPANFNLAVWRSRLKLFIRRNL